MPRKAKVKMGRPKGSKNKPKQILAKPIGRPQKIAMIMEGTDRPVVALQTMLWDSLRCVQCGQLETKELRRVLNQTSDLLTVLEAQAQ